MELFHRSCVRRWCNPPRRAPRTVIDRRQERIVCRLQWRGLTLRPFRCPNSGWPSINRAIVKRVEPPFPLPRDGSQWLARAALFDADDGVPRVGFHGLQMPKLAFGFQ